LYGGYAKALAIYESIGERRGVRSIANNWGSLVVLFGFVERGRERLLRLRSSAEADADPRWLYYAESNLGVAAFADGDFAGAKAHELRALELARRLGSESRAALVLGDLGAAELELGDLDAALACVEEAAAINRRVGQRLALVGNLGRLALILARRSEFDQARAVAAELSEEQRTRPAAPRSKMPSIARVTGNCPGTARCCGRGRPASGSEDGLATPLRYDSLRRWTFPIKSSSYERGSSARVPARGPGVVR
jgi:tetratricopeptide (TPR) repeat protein